MVEPYSTRVSISSSNPLFSWSSGLLESERFIVARGSLFPRDGGGTPICLTRVTPSDAALNAFYLQCVREKGSNICCSVRDG